MDVTLHIGAHRTGTTTLQQCLAVNQDHLAEAGIAFWGPKRTRTGLFSGLIRHPDRTKPHQKKRAARSVGLIRLEIDRLAKAGYRHLIVSEENMIGCQRDNLRAERLYGDAARRLTAFRDAFDGVPLTIALSLRSQDSYWASLLSFCLARGAEAPTEALLDRLVTQPRLWRDLAGDVLEVFPGAAVTIWPFEAFVGLPELQLSLLTGDPVNHALRHRRHWHNAAPSRDKLRRILSLRGENPDWIAPGQGRWQPLGEDHVAALKAAYSEDLAWLRAAGDGRIRYIPDVQAHGRWLTERRGHQNDGFEREVG